MKKSPSVVYWLGNSLYLNITNRCPNNCYFCFRKLQREWELDSELDGIYLAFGERYVHNIDDQKL